MERVSTGVFGLDELMFGGFIKNTVNTVLGTSGCGKTIFSIQFLMKGLEVGRRCVYISFDLEEEDFIKSARSLGWNLKSFIEEGSLSVKRLDPQSTLMGGEFVRFIKGEDLQVVLDSFSPLIAEMDRVRNEVGWFFRMLKNSGTILITLEEPFLGSADVNLNIPIFLSDSVVYLKSIGYKEPYSRTLRILKHRMSPHAESVFPYLIVEGAGLVVYEKRGEGFDADLSNFPISENGKNALKNLFKEGVLTREDYETIRRRLWKR
ncbi:MAG: RAD55 family ATPase [Archaeoglobaceae archaeon]|nr:RAD55 family ATPase [Archaeoglobaceae archaeon]MCX8152244.1 RAD55 family ATPase [Archaeoglobaceae archaeon]MDW8013922.1 RAD55 family ATPase [Archaeoglobaceae archaeon]